MSQLDIIEQLEASLGAVDLSDKTNLSPSIVSVNIAFIVLIVVTLAVRLYVRLGMIRAAGLDDGLMVLAVVFAIALSGFCFRGIHFGFGQHIWNIATDPATFLNDAKSFTQSLYGALISYTTAITFTKCSIMASYFRVFRDKNFRRGVYATGAITISLWLCSVFATVFQCTPVQAAWDWTIADAHCIDIVLFYTVTSSINLATDILLVVAPLPIFWKMNMPTAPRVIVCVLFGFGGFACIASFLRLLQLHLLRSIDVSFGPVGGLNWSVAEVGTAIVCASVASMRPLGAKLLPKIFLSRTFAKTAPETHSLESTVVHTSDPRRTSFRFGSGETAVAADKWFETSSKGTLAGTTPPNEKMSDSGAGVTKAVNGIIGETRIQRPPQLAGGVLSPKLRGML